MRKLIVAALVAPVLATPAVAQDFSGARVEGRIGYDRVGLGASVTDGVDELSADDSRDGLAYGAEVGFDVQAGPSFIVGAYVGGDLTTTKYCTEWYGEDEACLKAGRNFTVGARIGVPVSAGALLYAKGGYSNGQLKLTYEDFEDILEDFEVSEERGGWHVGAGAEIALPTADGTYVKLEYVYTNYNSLEVEAEDVSATLDGDRHQALAGFGFRF